MNEIKHRAIQKTVQGLNENYQSHELLTLKQGMELPNRKAVINILRDLKEIIFPGYYGPGSRLGDFGDHYAGYRLDRLYDDLRALLATALLYECGEDGCQLHTEPRADEVCAAFFEKLPVLQQTLLKDVQAGFEGDPAAKSREEIIFCYPGFYAIYIYRVAHELYLQNVPYIPRIMTEYAHSSTGIDINPGAQIGEYFFIDHGTGVVIGETTMIGNHVKLYQGVTLGALSTRGGQQLMGVKRHPTVCDNVTIYSGASVLGGETVIGENTTIGGGTFITESVPANSRVLAKRPEQTIKSPTDVTD